MLNERKLSENELEQLKIAQKGLLNNKQALVKSMVEMRAKFYRALPLNKPKKKLKI